MVGLVWSEQFTPHRLKIRNSVVNITNMLRYSQGTLVTTGPGLGTFLPTEKVPRVLPTRHHLPVTTARDDLLHLVRTGAAVLVTSLPTLVAVQTVRPHPPAHLLAAIVFVSRVVGVAGQLGRGEEMISTTAGVSNPCRGLFGGVAGASHLMP